MITFFQYLSCANLGMSLKCQQCDDKSQHPCQSEHYLLSIGQEHQATQNCLPLRNMQLADAHLTIFNFPKGSAGPPGGPHANGKIRLSAVCTLSTKTSCKLVFPCKPIYSHSIPFHHYGIMVLVMKMRMSLVFTLTIYRSRTSCLLCNYWQKHVNNYLTK